MQTLTSKSFEWFIFTRTWWQQVVFAFGFDVINPKLLHIDSAHTKSEFFVGSIYTSPFNIFSECVMQIIRSRRWTLFMFTWRFIVSKSVDWSEGFTFSSFYFWIELAWQSIGWNIVIFFAGNKPRTFAKAVFLLWSRCI